MLFNLIEGPLNDDDDVLKLIIFEVGLFVQLKN